MRKQQDTHKQHVARMRREARATLHTYYVEPTPQDEINKRAAEIAQEERYSMQLGSQHLRGRSGWSGQFLGEVADLEAAITTPEVIEHLLQGHATLVEGEDWRADPEIGRDEKDTQAVGNAIRSVYRDKSQFPYKVTVQGGGKQSTKERQRKVSFSLRRMTEAELAEALADDDASDDEENEATEE